MQMELQGSFRASTDAGRWIADIARWGVRRWVHYAPHYRGAAFAANRAPGTGVSDMTSVAFLGDLDPAFRPHWRADEADWQQAQVLRTLDLCRRHGVAFHYAFPFPLFPVQDARVIARAAPDMFLDSGRLNLHHPRLPALLLEVLRTFHRAMPGLAGFNLWLCEGCGEIYKFTRQDLEQNSAWLAPLLGAFDQGCRELGVEGAVFAHDYFHTNRTRRNVYEALARYPDLVAMEDITWPEENGLLDTLGFLPEHDRQALFARNRVLLNALTDTEYIGQGRLPCVLPRWWKRHAQRAAQWGAYVMRGRCFVWDGGQTDLNFNRMNAYLLTRFVNEPDLDVTRALGDAVRECFGVSAPRGLAELLGATEPVLKAVIGLNGMCPLNHSRFPMGHYLDQACFGAREWGPFDRNMKAVDDLFSPPGTPLHAPMTDGLNAGRHWRCQLRTVAAPAAEYLAAKDRAIAWLEAKLPEARALAAPLDARQRALFVDAYEDLLLLARGMKLFIRAADTHYQWRHARTLDDRAAAERLRAAAQELRALAATGEKFAQRADDMRRAAEFMEGLAG